MRIIFGVICLLLSAVSATAQVVLPEGRYVGIRVVGSDTTYLSFINEVVVHGRRTFRSHAAERAYWRLVRNVKKTYPYAKLAAVKLKELDARYTQLTTKKERKKYAQEVEDALRAEFEGELRKLTLSQGRILLRLVDRETGNTTYEIVKDFRGSFSAVFWQAIARIFGSNLKSTYDPSKGEDRTIEQIIYQIEEGYL